MSDLNPPKVPKPDDLRTRIAKVLGSEIDALKSSDDPWVKHLARNGDFDLQKLAEAVIKNLGEYRREELLQFAFWLLKEEPGEGHEGQIVGKYLEQWKGSANCCEGGPQWGHAWTCPMAD